MWMVMSPSRRLCRKIWIRWLQRSDGGMQPFFSCALMAWMCCCMTLASKVRVYVLVVGRCDMGCNSFMEQWRFTDTTELGGMEARMALKKRDTVLRGRLRLLTGMLHIDVMRMVFESSTYSLSLLVTPAGIING